MRPSASFTCEAATERGVPWGRDLFTFVTSAAGHMMRTLQRPRKSRPSKRQVNHRRFLHNMIHRKFAEIEASNRQLASALFSQDNESLPVLSPHQVVTNDQSEETPKEESTTSLTSSPFPLIATSLGFSLLTPDHHNHQTVRDQGDLWALNIRLESPGEEMVHSAKAHNKDRNNLPFKTTEHVRDSRFRICQQPTDCEPQLDVQPGLIRFDSLERLTDTLVGENDSNHDENVQNCEKFREVPNTGLIQPHTARSQSPGGDVIALKTSGPFLLEPPPLTSCAFGMHIISDSSCSQNDSSSIVENPQPEVLDNLCLVDLDRDVTDSINPHSLSTPFCGTQEDEVQNRILSFGGAFVTYTNDLTDTTKHQHFNNEATSPAKGYNTSVTPSSNSTLESPFSSSDPFYVGFHCGTRSPYLDPNGSTSSHTNMKHTTEPNYGSQQNMEKWTRMFQINESGNSDTDCLTTRLSDLVHSDQVRTDDGRENVNFATDLRTTGSCSYGPSEVSKNKSPLMYGRSREEELHKEAELHFISRPQDNTTHHPRYRCHYQSCAAASSQTFPSLFHSSQRASECTVKHSAEQTDLEAFSCSKPISGTFQSQPYGHLGHHCIGPSPISLQNCTQSTMSSTRSGAHWSSNRFVGVARSFPAPSPKSHFHQILTPPVEEDWLFDDITEGQTSHENCLLSEKLCK